MTLGTAITGQLSSAADVDYFAVTVGAAGTLSLNFNRPNNAYSGYFTLQLEDANGVALASFIDSTDPQTFTVGVAQAGTYYARIGSQSSYSYYADQYSLTASHTAGSAAGFESESNNTRATADAVTLGTAITGQLSSAADVDWFQASVTAPTVLTVSFDAPTNSSYSEYFRVSILDAAGNLLANQATGTDKVFSFNAPSAGSYYAAVWAPDYYYDSGNYSLTITQAPNSGLLYESETNDTTGTADALIAGAPIHGQLSTATDLDYYALTLNSSGKLHLAFDSPTNSSYTNYFQLVLKDGAGNVLASQASGSDMLIDRAVGSAGTYYVGVAAGSSYSHSTAEYVLTVSAEVDIPIPGGAIVGTSLADRLTGSAGNDNFAGNGGNDQIDGGAGNDTAYFVTSQGNLAVSTLAGLTAVRGNYAAGAYADSVAKLWNIETIRTSNGDIALSQPAQPVTPIFGTAGADTLTGTAAADVLDGLGGSDVVNGGAGSDTLAYFANKGQLFIETVAGVTRVKGGANAAEYSNTTSYVTNVETLAFQQGETTTLQSIAGNVLYGSAGDDQIIGSAGDDVIVGRGGADMVNGGAGSDTLVFFAPSSAFTINFPTGADARVSITGAGNSEYAGKTVTAEGIETLVFTDRTQSIVALPGLVIVKNTLTLAEGGSSGIVSISLATAPTSAVTVNVTGDAQVAPATAQLTFDAQNWNTPQSVSVSAVNDAVYEGNHSGNLRLSVSTTDSFYVGVGSTQITYTISDNDNPATGAVTGLVWGDSNRDALVGATEGGLAGWIVFDDANRNSKLDSGEKSAGTDASGHYAIADLSPGAHTISILQKPGWTPTYPNAKSAEVSVISPSSVIGEVALDGTIGIDVPVSSVSYANLGNTTRVEDFHKDARFVGIDGHGYAVVVIDTGIDLDQPFFGPDTNGNGIADRIIYQYDFFGTNDPSAQDGAGHGTHVAGIIGSSDSLYPGIAPEVNLVVLKVFPDSAGGASFQDIAEALQWVIANATQYNIASVNLSLGDGQFLTSRTTGPLSTQFKALAEMGVTVVSASGNSYADYQHTGVSYPAADPYSLSIGAAWKDSGTYGTYQTGTADAIAFFSQRDPGLTDVFAPGVYIDSSKNGGGNVKLSGTSMAAPEVAGMVALAQQLADQELGRRLTFQEIKGLIHSTGTPIVDGDNENDVVNNTGATYYRIDMMALADAIVDMKPTLSQQITVTAGQTAENANFGFAGLNETRGLVSDDVIIGTASGEQISGMGGDDIINALGGDDVVFGNEGDDKLLGGAGTDQLDGGSGNDTASYENLGGRVVASLTAKTAQKLPEGTIDTLSNIENLIGSAFDDQLTGDAQANWIQGGEGNDTMIGGAGNDIYIVDNVKDVVIENVNEGTDLIQSSVTYTLSANVESLALTGSGDINGTGNALDNVITGNAGANTLIGDAGNDTLTGGLGQDTAVFTGTRSSYTIARTATGATVTGTDGTDIVNGVEWLQFDDALITGGWKVLVDHNGDGKSDILWRDSITGEVYEYLMDGNRVAGYGHVDTVATKWVIVGSGDYNGDGKSDILWRDSITGEVYEYLMDGNRVAGYGHVDTVATKWVIVGSGDYNGDGKSDILWRDSITGEVYEYLMDGSRVAGYGHVDTVATKWVIVGSGDYNGDGKSDILWRDSITGEVYEYLMDGSRVAGYGHVDTVATNWVIANDGEAMNLRGGEGADHLYGGGLNDILTGGLGNDVLTGGGGADRFVFRAGDSGAANADRITDFTSGPGGDVLIMRDLLTGYNPASSLITAFVQLSVVSGSTQIYVDGDGPGGAQTPQLIATLDGVTGLLLNDLLATQNLVLA